VVGPARLRDLTRAYSPAAECPGRGNLPAGKSIKPGKGRPSHRGTADEVSFPRARDHIRVVMKEMRREEAFPAASCINRGRRTNIGFPRLASELEDKNR